jgi:hypothetical protein
MTKFTTDKVERQAEGLACDVVRAASLYFVSHFPEKHYNQAVVIFINRKKEG